MTSSQSSNGINIVDNDPYTSFCGSVQDKNIQGTEHGRTSSIRTVAFWVCTAVAFGVGLGLIERGGKASEFFAGYLLEQSLSVDNLFVFVLIFNYFKVPIMYQNRVLSYGITGAIIFRLSLILLGTATLQRFEAVNLLLDAILYIIQADYDGNRFLTYQDDAWKVGGRCTHSFLKVSLSWSIYSLPATVLGLIGCKMISNFLGFHVSTEVSLGFVAICLSAGVVLSLMRKSD